MRIVFVRHGHPDYANDCLTPLGHRHAAAAAQRLKQEGITQIFSSTCGRAFETAGHLAQVLDLPIVKCDFMREISWGALDDQSIYADGHPWSTADRMVANGESLMEKDWQTREPFCRNTVIRHAERVAGATDEWLAGLGYVREGLYYRAVHPTDKTVVAFGHGGESSVLLSHLFNLPFPFLCTAMGPDYTGITIVTLSGAPGELVCPRFELLNDARHIRGLEAGNYFGN